MGQGVGKGAGKTERIEKGKMIHMCGNVIIKPITLYATLEVTTKKIKLGNFNTVSNFSEHPGNHSKG